MADLTAEQLADLSQMQRMPGMTNYALQNFAGAMANPPQPAQAAQPSQQSQDLGAMYVDPALQTLGDQETQLATNFQNSIPQLENTFADQVSQVNKKNLADSIANNTSSYNARGLLYSGGLKGANAAAQTTAAQAQASDVATENQKLQDTSNKLNSAAYGTQAAIAGEQGQIGSDQSAIQQQYLNYALQNQASQNQIIGSAIGLGTGAAGYAAGGLLKSGGTNPTGTATGGYNGANLGVNTNLGYSSPSSTGPLGVDTNLGYQ